MNISNILDFNWRFFFYNRRVYKYDSDDNVIEEVWYNKSLAGWDESTRWVYYFSKHEVSSVDLLPDFNKYTLYPNPAHEFLNVKNLQNEDIQIYDLSGKLMISKKYNADNTLDISVLNKGVYIITITDKNNNTVSKKFVKQ